VREARDQESGDRALRLEAVHMRKIQLLFLRSMRPFTDYFPDYGGFTSRADGFALLPWWLPSPSCLSCAGLFTSATTVWICPI